MKRKDLFLLFVILSCGLHAASQTVEVVTHDNTGWHLKKARIVHDTIANEKGDIGISGNAGLQGNTGNQGSTGAQGVQGNTGATGGTGATGSNGATGSQGSQGIQGVTGSAGSNGTNGSNGSNGSNGATGATGLLSQTVYDSLGISAVKSKKWEAIVTPSTGNGNAINISSAGFTTTVGMFCSITPLRAVSAAATTPNVAIKSISTTSLVVNITENNPATVSILGIGVLSGLPSIFVATPSDIRLHILIEGN